MKLVSENIQYEKFKGNICGGLKVTAVLLAMQLGLTKFCCFLCEWDSGGSNHLYLKKKLWPKREWPFPGQKNVVNASSTNPEKLYLPPSHIKLGLAQNFFKAMDKNIAGFMYLKNTEVMLNSKKGYLLDLK
jgi:hypothetical protein